MMETQRYPLDQLIRDAAKHGELVVFVGAGASMLCGSPDWRGFSNKVVDALEGGGILGFLEAEQLRGFADPRRTLSIAMALAKEKININFDQILHPQIAFPKGRELYDLLSGLRPVFVTTNYDRWLDDAGPEVLSPKGKDGKESEPATRPSERPKYYLPEHFSSALLAERGAVIHLHGSCTDSSTMVVSLKDYIRHYADERVQAFLSAMFKNHTVLFVGYGLAELEILDYIIRSNESLKSGVAEPRHFLLYAYRSTESVQKQFIEHFFREQCGVRVIPYCIDAKGHQEVVEVFKCWAPELDVRDPTTLDLQVRLDRCISSPTPANRDAALRLVNKWPELASYFMNSLKDAIWFSDVDKAGFFNTEHSPSVTTKVTDRGTTYQAEGWPALRYLEQIATSVNGDQAKRVVDIVRIISSEAQKRGIDNWRTSWSLATILSQLPLEHIHDQDIEMARAWLASRFESNMVGHELSKNLLPRLLDSPESSNWHKAMLLVDVLSMVKGTGEPS